MTITLLIIAFILIWFVYTNNRFIKQRIIIQEELSGIWEQQIIEGSGEW